eukprot:263834-Alexandrium_andersonii.AAC.1
MLKLWVSRAWMYTTRDEHFHQGWAEVYALRKSGALPTDPAPDVTEWPPRPSTASNAEGRQRKRRETR